MTVMTVLTTQNPINIIQLTDTHLYGTSVGTLLKMNTRHSLDQVIKIVKQQEGNVDLVLATGDIAQDASTEAYSIFLDVVSELNTPFRWIPGNHDSASIMTGMAEDTGANNRLAQLNNWLLVLLDTSIEGEVHGRLDGKELDFLESNLQAAQDNDAVEHCLIVLHHNPIPGNAGWMKDIGLDNGMEFFDLIERFDKVKCTLYGHIHQELDFYHRGIRCLCTPSTCIQFKPHVTNFALDKLNPGYRSLKLFEDGTVVTEVKRVTDHTFEVDYGSTGY